MAYIDYISSARHVSLYIEGLDGNYSYDGRIVYFFLYDYDTDTLIDARTTTIEAYKTMSPYVAFRNLTPSTRYYAEAYIDNIMGVDTKLFTRDDIWTDDAVIGSPYIDVGSRFLSNGVSLNVRLCGLNQDDVLIDSRMVFVLYISGKYDPVYTSDSFELGKVVDSVSYDLDYILKYDTKYELLCAIYTDSGSTYYTEVKDLNYASIPTISARRSPDNSYLAEITIDLSKNTNSNSLYLTIFSAIDFNKNMSDSDYEYYNSWKLSYLSDSYPATFTLSLKDAGAHRLVISDDEYGVSWWDICDIQPLYTPNIIDDTMAETNQYITWTISNIATEFGVGGYVNFYANGEYAGDVWLSDEYNLSAVYTVMGNESQTVELIAEIRTSDGKTLNIIGPIEYTFPPSPSAKILVSRDSNNPNNIYLTIDSVKSQNVISKIEIKTRLAGLTSYQTVAQITNPMTYPIDLTFYQMGMAKRRFYALITNVHGGTFTSNYTSVLFVPWEWPEQEYTLLTEGGATRDFRYSVWNNLVSRMSEAHLVATRSEWDDDKGKYASYDNTLMTDTNEGRKLTALKYNSLKHQIDHNYSTGINDVEKGDLVSGQDHFINLTDKFNQWITTVLDKKN